MTSLCLEKTGLKKEEGYISRNNLAYGDFKGSMGEIMDCYSAHAEPLSASLSISRGYMSQWILPNKSSPAIKEIKEFLKGPEGISLIKEVLNTPEGKKILDNEIEKRIDFVESQYECIDMCRDVTDEEALSEIKSYLRGLKDEGVSEIDMFDIVVEFNLPPEQIERVMEKIRR